MDTQAQTRQTVITTISAILKCEVTPDTAQTNTPQWDSLKHINIIFAIEDAFGVQFDEDELAKLTSVSALVTRLS